MGSGGGSTTNHDERLRSHVEGLSSKTNYWAPGWLSKRVLTMTCLDIDPVRENGLPPMQGKTLLS